MFWIGKKVRKSGRKIHLNVPAVLLVLSALLTGCGSRRIVVEEGSTAVHENGGSPEIEAVLPTEAQQPEDVIYVHVSGEVSLPGVYAMHRGDRVFQAVEAAGGFTRNADRDWVNLALVLSDEQRIRIYSLDETAAMLEEEPAGRPDELPDAAQQPEEGNANGQGQENGQINLNTADLAQLMTLPGIGQRRAEDILAYRAMHGGFQAVEELTQISGIGEKLLAKIADRVCVG